MDEESTIRKMTALGISEPEARIYCALLRKRELSALEIQEIAHVPRTKVYEITRKMAAKNMCIEKQVNARRQYQAVEPQKCLNHLLDVREKAMNDNRRIVHELQREITPWFERSRYGMGHSESIEIIKNLPSIRERYLTLLAKAKDELIGLVKPPFIHQYEDVRIRAQDELLVSRMRKGLKARMVYEMPAEDRREWFFSYIRKCKQAGEQARVIERLPMKVYIFDRQYILMMLANARTEISPITMFVVDHPPLAVLGIALFEALWKEARDYRILTKTGCNGKNN